MNYHGHMRLNKEEMIQEARLPFLRVSNGTHKKYPKIGTHQETALKLHVPSGCLSPTHVYTLNHLT